MKKIVPTFAISLMAATPLIYVTSCGTNVVHVESVVINEGPNRTMFMNDILPLTCTISPANATNKNVTWSSQDQSVVDVDALGNVVVKGYGETNIIVKTEDGQKEAMCAISEISTPQLADRELDDVEKWGTYTQYSDVTYDVIVGIPYSYGFYCKNTIDINRRKIDAISLLFKENGEHTWRFGDAIFMFDGVPLIEGEENDYYWENNLGYIFTEKALDKFFSSGYFKATGYFNDTADTLTTRLLFHEKVDN